jgi:hypothetical protein
MLELKDLPADFAYSRLQGKALDDFHRDFVGPRIAKLARGGTIVDRKEFLADIEAARAHAVLAWVGGNILPNSGAGAIDRLRQMEQAHAFVSRCDRKKMQRELTAAQKDCEAADAELVRAQEKAAAAESRAANATAALAKLDSETQLLSTGDVILAAAWKHYQSLAN